MISAGRPTTATAGTPVAFYRRRMDEPSTAGKRPRIRAAEPPRAAYGRASPRSTADAAAGGSGRPSAAGVAAASGGGIAAPAAGPEGTIASSASGGSRRPASVCTTPVGRVLPRRVLSRPAAPPLCPHASCGEVGAPHLSGDGEQLRKFTDRPYATPRIAFFRNSGRCTARSFGTPHARPEECPEVQHRRRSVGERVAFSPDGVVPGEVGDDFRGDALEAFRLVFRGTLEEVRDEPDARPFKPGRNGSKIAVTAPSRALCKGSSNRTRGLGSMDVK